MGADCCAACDLRIVGGEKREAIGVCLARLIGELCTLVGFDSDRCAPKLLLFTKKLCYLTPKLCYFTAKLGYSTPKLVYFTLILIGEPYTRGVGHRQRQVCA